MADIQPLHHHSANPYWIKITYERNEYIINLACIKSFCREPNGRITFWLPDSSIPIIISPVSNPESYELVVKHIESLSGYRF
ncbi:hypothetical protein NIES3974_21920 [Calothrix sp. NIES-3974]|nr:hypothetical protein NIES3974_21920 [Calothrix sp. NIES-3974]